MRRILFALIVLCGAFAGPLVALAQDAEQRATVLHLNQSAERMVTRDLLRLELRVEEAGADPRTLQGSINRRMAAAVDRAKQAEGIQVETGSYRVGEERLANRPATWRGSQPLILRSKNADVVLKLAGMLQSDGLVMSSLSYEVSHETLQSAQNDLTAAALDALRLRAEAVAGSLHLAVLRYRDLRVGNAEAEGGLMPRLAGAMAATAAPVAEPGEAVIRVTVEAELLLAPSRP